MFKEGDLVKLRRHTALLRKENEPMVGKTSYLKKDSLCTILNVEEPDPFHKIVKILYKDRVESVRVNLSYSQSEHDACLARFFKKV